VTSDFCLRGRGSWIQVQKMHFTWRRFHRLSTAVRWAVLGTLLLLTIVPVRAAAVDWEVLTGLEHDLYPSVIVATANYDWNAQDEDDPTFKGDPWGQVGISIKNPKANSTLVMEIESGTVIKPTKFRVKLEEAGETYAVFPPIKYDYATLLGVRQPFPEIVSIRLTLNGEEIGETDEKMTVRSINDCPFLIINNDDEYFSYGFMFSAYVNENHPFIDKILRQAINTGETSSFAGYQGSEDDVLREMKAIWNALKERGFRYSSITRASKTSENVATQHVRLIGDSIKTSQANCVDGSVLFASIFLKLGLHPFLVTIPGHMFVGVFLDDKRESFVCLETTMLGEASFEDAIQAGDEAFEENRKELTDEDSQSVDHEIIDVSEEREFGLLPLREPGADR